MLRTVLFAAILAGTLTGVLYTGIQHLQLIPLIHAAESYETGAYAQQHVHDNGEVTERQLFTLLANVLSGISFSLLLASAIILSRQTGWRKGLLWGLGGYLSFFVAPSLGLSPKLPGTHGAPIDHQQVWWIATVTATVIGLCLMVFSRHVLLKMLGLILVVLPHIIGAPQPEQVYSAAPEQMRHDFIVASALANAGFWIILGFLSGYLLHRTETTDLAHAQQ